MKKPDFIGGFTKFPNKLLERVFCKGLLTQYESQVLLTVARLTWGWNKPWCYSSYGELSEMTGISRAKVYAVCKDLHARCILLLGTGRKKTRFEISRNLSTWVLPRESRKNELFPVEGTPAVPCGGNTCTPQTVDRLEIAGRLRSLLKTYE